MSSERGECDVILLSSGYCMMISHAFAKSNPFLCFYADNDAVDGDVDDSDDDDDKELDDEASRCEGEHYVATHFAATLLPRSYNAANNQHTMQMRN